MYFLSDVSNFSRKLGSKDKKPRFRRRGSMNIANTIQPGYKPLMTSYLSSSLNPGKILRLQYQRNDKTKDVAFLGKPRHLNNKEQQEFQKKGFIKGDYDKEGNKLL